MSTEQPQYRNDEHAEYDRRHRLSTE